MSTMADWQAARIAYYACPEWRHFRKRKLFKKWRQTYFDLRAEEGMETDVDAMAARWWNSGTVSR